VCVCVQLDAGALDDACPWVVIGAGGLICACMVNTFQHLTTCVYACAYERESVRACVCGCECACACVPGVSMSMMRSEHDEH